MAKSKERKAIRSQAGDEVPQLAKENAEGQGSAQVCEGQMTLNIPMRTADEYDLHLSAEPNDATAEWVFGLVWRFDFTASGFCLLDIGPGMDSHILRSWMLRLTEGLSEINIRRTGKPFAYRSIGRFDQHETTKFHLDGAPDQSLLLLGYEPSKVRSRLSLADYTRCAFDLGITPQQFWQDFNPMFKNGEELLARYVTELPQAKDGHARILLINNSSLPFTEDRTNPLGIMHKAEIVNPTEKERRIVNSILLMTAAPDEVGPEQQEEFLTTEKISPKVYG